MDSEFYLDVNGEFLTLKEDLNIISGKTSEDRFTSHVLIIPNQNLAIKHAIIKITESQECQIIDICSGISVKNDFNEQEKLIPMKWYKLCVGQSIILGSVEAVLKKNEYIFSQEVIEASPNVDTVKSRYLSINKSKTSSSFQEVPATEEQTESDLDKLTQTNVFIPETQAFDESLTQHYETDSYQIKQDSQSIFSELPDYDEKHKDLLYTYQEELASIEPNNDLNLNDRECSVTPELTLEDFTSIVIKQEPLTQSYCQSNDATQLLDPKSLQSDIATQLFAVPNRPESSDTKNDSLYSCETQQLTLIDNTAKTRKRTKDESLKISRVESIAVFDIATQPMLVKPTNNHIYDIATQVYDASGMFDKPVKRSSISKLSRNRIFDSSEDDDDNADNVNTPIKSFTIAQRDNTPDFIPEFNNGSQMYRDIVEVNLSQNTDDDFSFLITNEHSAKKECKKLDDHPVKPKFVNKVVKKKNIIRKNLMKFNDSENVIKEKVFEDDASDQEALVSSKMVKRRDSARTSDPVPSKLIKRRDSARASDPVPIKVSTKRDSFRNFDSSIKELTISKTSTPFRTSDRGAKEPSNRRTKDTIKPSEKDVSLSKSKTAADTSENNKSGSKTRVSNRTSKSPVKEKTTTTESDLSLPEPNNRKKDLNLKRPLAENVLEHTIAKRKCPEIIPDPEYIVAVTNYAERSKIQKHCNIMGFQLNDEIMLANVLISNDKIKFTSKFLAAMCKGIPIVTAEWLVKCVKKKKPLNPINFIIIDKECEQSKRFSMRNVLQKSVSDKFLKNYSVYVTPNTKPLFSELKNILECAGAECLDLTQKASNTEIIGIANVNDMKEIKELKKRFGSKFKILPDTSVCEAIIHQKLSFNRKFP